MVVFGLKPLIDVFLSKRAKTVLVNLGTDDNSQYDAVKRISKEKNIATSTIKFVLKKLALAGLVECNGSVRLTKLGIAICNELRGDENV